MDVHDARLDAVYAYLTDHADIALDRLRQQLAMPGEDLFDRKNFAGHITASGLVLTPDHREILLVWHLGLGRWLQPGGHVDEHDAEIWQAAAREIREETAVVATLHPWHAAHGGEPADIDTHEIPARPANGEGGHFHHDALFVFVADRTLPQRQEDEVSSCAWCALDDPRVPNRLRKVLAGLRTASIDQKDETTP